MFCRNCGNQLVENAKFCSKCGTPTNAQNVVEVSVNNTIVENKIDNNVIKYTLRPMFNLGYKFCTTAVYTLAFVLLFGVYCCIELDLSFVYLVLEGKIAILPILAIIGIIVMLIIAISLLFEKLQYDKLRYDFYNEKLEYIDGFLNKEQKTLKYKNIREVVMAQSFIERMFNIGTIKIYTNASSVMPEYSASRYRNNHGPVVGKNGVTIHCVTNVREKYILIKEIIDEAIEE